MNTNEKYISTKVIELGSCCFRQPNASSHCRYLHGYRLTAKVWFKCHGLDENNWVVDFGGLKELKHLFQNHFDHTTIIAKNDPFVSVFLELCEKGVCNLRIMEGVGIEKFAEWCYNTANAYIRQITNERCWVEKVEVWEHEKNSAMYGV